MDNKNDKPMTCNDILNKYPTLKLSTLDYLVRNRIIRVTQRGRSIPRIYTQESLTDIETWLRKRGDL